MGIPMGMLFVECKECGSEFPTGISVGFAGRPVLGMHEYTCPDCGHTDAYEGEDYFEKEQEA